MEISSHHEDEFNPYVRMDVILRTRTVEMHSEVSDNLDLRADIRKVLENAGQAIAQISRRYVKAK